MVLTNSEIMDINQNAEFDSAIGYARAIESAVLERLKAQEPLGTAGDLMDDYVLEQLEIRSSTSLYLRPLPPDDVVRDGERYRWLRDSGKGDDLIRGDCRGVYLPEASALDAAIDAAMKEMK